MDEGWRDDGIEVEEVRERNGSWGGVKFALWLFQIFTLIENKGVS